LKEKDDEKIHRNHQDEHDKRETSQNDGDQKPRQHSEKEDGNERQLTSDPELNKIIYKVILYNLSALSS
jgi:hypothetical protein